jgi:ankyrin repeat protein
MVLGMDLFMAIRAGDVARVKELAAQGEDVTKPDADGWTALHLAAYDGRDQVVRALMQLGAALDAPTRDGATAHAIR